MTGPKRIQLRRTRGWRMPEGALKVARPSRWGNPYRVGDEITVSVTGHSHGAVVGDDHPQTTPAEETL